MMHEMSDTAFTLFSSMRTLQTLPDSREKSIILYYICELIEKEIGKIKEELADFQEVMFVCEGGRL